MTSGLPFTPTMLTYIKPGLCRKVSIHLHQIFTAVTVLCLLLLPRAASAQAASGLTVAAAADLKYALEEVGQAYTRKAGVPVRVTYGSSGNLFAQISNGAPFDVFLSADAAYPKRLADVGQAAPDTITEYARGVLAMWIPAPVRGIDKNIGLTSLLMPEIKRVAIANPRHAPYGRAAEAALRQANIYDQVAPKFILGENIAQTAQFVQSGNADAGIVALSLLKGASGVQGTWWELPLDSYPPLEQAAVVTKRAEGNKSAREFVSFLVSPEARAIFERFGFRPPSGAKR